MKKVIALLALPHIMVLVGCVLNWLPLYYNGGFMPVKYPGGCGPNSYDWNHMCMSATTRFNFLGDWISSNNGIHSIGDFIQGFAGDIQHTCYAAALLMYLHICLKHFKKDA
jgi:hypothetical protein